MRCPKCGQYDNWRTAVSFKTDYSDMKKLECLHCGTTWPVEVVPRVLMLDERESDKKTPVQVSK